LSKFDNKPVTRLTELEVSEVSLVDRGAIGEVFTVIKSEDENEDLVNKIKLDGICEQLQNMSDVEFVKIMGQMMQKFNSLNKVNKGGSEMDPEEIKTLIAEVVGKSLETVNKNFVAVNKSIDEIQKKLTATPAAETDEEKKKKEEEAAKNNVVHKAVEEIGKAVKDLGEAVSGITKSLQGVTDQVQKISDMKLDEAVSGVSKRLETIEKQENPANGVEAGEEVNKGAEKKTVFWKSFVGNPEE
jgi:uncharacterized protein YoxC